MNQTETKMGVGERVSNTLEASSDPFLAFLDGRRGVGAAGLGFVFHASLLIKLSQQLPQ